MDTLTRRLEEGSDESILQLPSALLEEKNLEIDHLNQQIHQLQQELDMTNDNKVRLYLIPIHVHVCFCFPQITYSEVQKETLIGF